MTRRSVPRPARLARSRIADDGRTRRAGTGCRFQLSVAGLSVVPVCSGDMSYQPCVAGQLTALWAGASSGRRAEGPRRRWRSVCARWAGAIAASMAAQRRPQQGAVWCVPDPGRSRRVLRDPRKAAVSPCRRPRTAGRAASPAARPVPFCRYGFLPPPLALPVGLPVLQFRFVTYRPYDAGVCRAGVPWSSRQPSCRAGCLISSGAWPPTGPLDGRGIGAYGWPARTLRSGLRPIEVRGGTR